MLTKFLPVAFLALLLPAAMAQDWEPMGPQGGSFFGVVSDPANADVVTIVGGYGVGNVYRSKNGGDSWTLIGQGNFGVVDFETTDFNTLYVAGYDNNYMYGYYKSTDGGANWTSGTVSIGYPYAVEPHPTDPNIVYGCGYNYSGGYETYFYKSTDGGATWTATHLSTTAGIPYSMSISKQNPDTLYMCGFNYTGAYEQKFWKSTDGGATWTEPTGVPWNPAEIYPTHIEVDPTDDNYIYMGGMYLYVSSDGGATWTDTGVESNFTYDVAIDPTNNANVFAAAGNGLFSSADHGMTWTPSAGAGGNPSCLEVCAADSTQLYYSAYYIGVAKSVDSGVNWEMCCNGILESSIYGLDVSDSAPNTLFASPYGFTGLVISHDSAATWDDGEIPPEGTYCSEIVINSNNPDIILVDLPGG
jgi:photosystem II stability/assembly factor-like uncharacterized protein